jgi:hypothetical protein
MKLTMYFHMTVRHKLNGEQQTAVVWSKRVVDCHRQQSGALHTLPGWQRASLSSLHIAMTMRAAAVAVWRTPPTVCLSLTVERHVHLAEVRPLH